MKYTFKYTFCQELNLNTLAVKSYIIFYTQRILSTLFPHNFPKFYTSFFGDEEKDLHSGTIRQRINSQNKDKRFITYPFRDVSKIIHDLNIPIDIDDSFSGNFMIGIDGGEYYVDKTELKEKWRSDGKSLKWNSSKILAYMEEKDFSPLDERIVIRSIARLQTLTGNGGDENVVIP